MTELSKLSRRTADELLTKMDMSERLAAIKLTSALDGMSAQERACVLRWAYERFVPPYQRRSEATP